MARERFKKQDIGSFFGNYVYDRLVPHDHFLRKLEEIVPWQRFTEATEYIQRTKDEIMGKRDLIPADSHFRSTFLENIPLHREICAAFV